MTSTIKVCPFNSFYIDNLYSQPGNTEAKVFCVAVKKSSQICQAELRLRIDLLLLLGLVQKTEEKEKGQRPE